MPEAARRGGSANQRSRQGKSGDEKPVIVTPLYSAGIEHATVYTPLMGIAPDPLNLLSTEGVEAPFMDVGGGDYVQDWQDLYFADDEVSGKEPHQSRRLR